MTAQEQYIADQKASAHDIMVEIAESVCCNIEEPAGSGAGYGITEDGQDEIQAIIEVLLSNNVNSESEMNMGTQEQTVFDVTIVEKTEDLHEGSGVVQKINREILFDGKVTAVGNISAQQKAMAKCPTLSVANADDDIFDRLEITCKPFCG